MRQIIQIDAEVNTGYPQRMSLKSRLLCLCLWAGPRSGRDFDGPELMRLVTTEHSMHSERGNRTQPDSSENYEGQLARTRVSLTEVT